MTRRREPAATGWRRVRRAVCLALPLLAVVIVTNLGHWRSGTGTPTLSLPHIPRLAPIRAAGDRLVVEPDDGMEPIDALLASAHRSLDLTMYELVDPTAEAVLADDVSRGVRVRVVLDSRLERSRNTPAYDFLRSRGVQVAWSSSRYSATHEKTFVIDGSTSVIMSLNLASQYYATTRDVAVVDRDPSDAAAVEVVFEADFRGAQTPTPVADDLVWSPTQSQPDLVALIDAARRSVLVESEELNSPPVLAALVAAARRGVDVRLVMTYSSEWAPGFDRVAAAGGHVAVMHGESPLYIHAKLLVVDAGTPRGRAFVGSENLGPTSLLHDRELGLVLLAPSLVDRLARLVSSDVAAGSPWSMTS